MDASGQGEKIRIKIWDWPTRLIHWLFVLLIPAAWWTAEEHHLEWHRRIGYVLLALLVFRLVWGFIGSSTARFAGFITGPKAALRYARGRDAGRRRIGHNPLGGWSVAAMLILMVLQVGLGLFAIDIDGLEAGPLADLISFDAARKAAELHEVSFNLLLAFIVLHVGAILYYAFIKRDDLVRPMLSGSGMAAPGTEPMRAATGARAIATLAGAGAIAWWISQGAPL
jgi:cytochrome b